jgi:hypothetical protein
MRVMPTVRLFCAATLILAVANVCVALQFCVAPSNKPTNTRCVVNASLDDLLMVRAVMHDSPLFTLRMQNDSDTGDWNSANKQICLDPHGQWSMSIGFCTAPTRTTCEPTHCRECSSVATCFCVHSRATQYGPNCTVANAHVVSNIILQEMAATLRPGQAMMLPWNREPGVGDLSISCVADRCVWATPSQRKVLDSLFA